MYVCMHACMQVYVRVYVYIYVCISFSCMVCHRHACQNALQLCLYYGQQEIITDVVEVNIHTYIHTYIPVRALTSRSMRTCSTNKRRRRPRVLNLRHQIHTHTYMYMTIRTCYQRERQMHRYPRSRGALVRRLSSQ